MKSFCMSCKKTSSRFLTDEELHDKLVSCDESIGSLEPFALRRSTFNCNAGADLEQLCEPAVLTERCLESLTIW